LKKNNSAVGGLQQKRNFNLSRGGKKYEKVNHNLFRGKENEHFCGVL
jgi:hypothetical protein